MRKFIHEVKLPETNEFSKRFNGVSDLFAIAQKEDTKEAWDEYHSQKYRLEQGLPIAFPNERKFTLDETLEIWEAAISFQTFPFDTSNKQEYFKEKFGIDLGERK